MQISVSPISSPITSFMYFKTGSWGHFTVIYLDKVTNFMTGLLCLLWSISFFPSSVLQVTYPHETINNCFFIHRWYLEQKIKHPWYICDFTELCVFPSTPGLLDIFGNNSHIPFITLFHITSLGIMK